jgi:hypothetical protein
MAVAFVYPEPEKLKRRDLQFLKIKGFRLPGYLKGRRVLRLCSHRWEDKRRKPLPRQVSRRVRRSGTRNWLRACQRIGEISRDMERSKGGSNPQATLPTDGKGKADALAEAGINELVRSVGKLEKIVTIGGGHTRPSRHHEFLLLLNGMTFPRSPGGLMAQKVLASSSVTPL